MTPERSDDPPASGATGDPHVFDDSSPIYLQIAERIRADVLSGALDADDPVMSTNQYAEFYGINPATAAKAFHQLLDEGVIYKRRGVGMFVSPGARSQLLEDRRGRFFDEVLDPVLDRAEVLGIPVEALIAHVAARTTDAGGDGTTSADPTNGATP